MCGISLDIVSSVFLALLQLQTGTYTPNIPNIFFSFRRHSTITLGDY